MTDTTKLTGTQAVVEARLQEFKAKTTEALGEQVHSKVAILEEQVKQLQLYTENLHKVFGNTLNSVHIELSQKFLALEQSYLSLSKITSALLATAIKKSLLTNEELVQQLRDADDKFEQDRIEDMAEAGFIALTDKVGPETIMVFTQALVASDGTKTQLSNYRTVRLPDLGDEDEFRKAVLGKEIGDTINTTQGQDNFVLQIKQVYQFTDKGKVTAEQTNAATPTEEAPTEAQTPAGA